MSSTSVLRSGGSDTPQRVTADSGDVRASHEHKARIAIAHLIAEQAASFVNVPGDQVDDLIVVSLRRLAEALHVERVILWRLTDDNLGRTHAWVHPDFELPPETVPLAQDFPWFLARIRANEPVWNPSLNDLPDVPDRANLSRYQTKATAVVPLSVDGKVCGALSFAALRDERSWDLELREQLRLMATVFAQALARRDSQETLRRALREVEELKQRLALENAQLRQEVTTLAGSRVIAAESAAVQRVIEQIEAVAPTNATVLLLGETGTGKEVFAQAIHDRSNRHDRPMVRVNCAAIPSALIESELFGRERGAYTGALSRQAGRFEVAHGSTLFLDEIGELPLESQAKLLRVIQERTIERLGSSRPIAVDVRIIAATNRDLTRAVAERTFREDLYFRLDVFPIRVPPLRERQEDIRVLAWTFVEEYSKLYGKPIESIAPESLHALQRHAWPGNVRELRNLIERAVILARGPHLVIEPPQARSAPEITDALADVEEQHIREVLEQTGWRIRGAGGAAERLQLKPTTLESRMEKMGIQRPRNGSRSNS